MAKASLQFAVARAAFAAALLAGCATAASAEGTALPARSFSKAEAIIGGPSALAAVLAEQGVVRPPAPLETAPLRPASYRIPAAPRLSAAVRRLGVAPGVLSGRPDVFGTVALKVDHTPLDSRWQRVEHARIGGRAAAYAASLRSSDEETRLEAINHYVNGRVHFADDSRQYGRADEWASADDTLRRGQGDCEDYAIAKLQMLRAAGFSDRDLYLVILRDLVRRADHAVAVVRSGNRMLVLDNGTDMLLDSEAVSDYRPVLTFAANGTWTHGYRIDRAPVEIAAAGDEPAVTLPDAIEPIATMALASFAPQRSRSASLLAFNTGFSR